MAAVSMPPPMLRLSPLNSRKNPKPHVKRPYGAVKVGLFKGNPIQKPNLYRTCTDKAGLFSSISPKKPNSVN